MKIRKSSTKLGRLKEKYLSSKAAALFFLNRRAKTLKEEGFDFGVLTDIELDRQNKELLLEVTDRGEGVTIIGINGYRFENRKGEPWLVWRKIACEGAQEERYRRLFLQMGGIRMSKRYFALVEAVL